MKTSSPFDHSALHEKAADSIERKGTELLGLGVKRPFPKRAPDPFPTRREMETITDRDIIGEPKLSYTDITGRTLARYFAKEGHEIGLFDGGYDALRRLVEQTLKTKPFNQGLSPEFLEEQVFDWWIENYGADKPSSLSEHLIAKADDAFSEHHLVIPISAIEIERPFQIGDVLVAPMNRQMLTEMGKAAKEKNPEQADIINKKIGDFVRELGHLTAVQVKVVGEVGFAKAHAERRAFQVAEMLRFMSPAALSWNVAFPCFPHGCHHNRTTTVLTVADNAILNISEGLLDYGMFSWRMTFAELDRDMKNGFSNFASFFKSAPLTPFQERVGKAISTFSEGVGSHNVNNRLVYAMSSLEHLFLRDEQEPIQSGVGDRIAFLIEKEGGKRREIVANFKKSYSLRSKQIHHLSTVDDEKTLSEFFKNSWMALYRALTLMPNFTTHLEFLNAIENVKYGGGRTEA
ncbi:HEPN domain-containing protein [Sphingopyxis soli]|nr:HEPN domain-containing protein [Sphingopyxis soli]